MVLSAIIMSLSSFGGKLGKTGLYWSSGTGGSVAHARTWPGSCHEPYIGSLEKRFAKLQKHTYSITEMNNRVLNHQQLMHPPLLFLSHKL